MFNKCSIVNIFSLRTIKWIKRIFFMLKNTYSVIILHFTIYDNTKFVDRKVNKC